MLSSSYIISRSARCGRMNVSLVTLASPGISVIASLMAAHFFSLRLARKYRRAERRCIGSREKHGGREHYSTECSARAPAEVGEIEHGCVEEKCAPTENILKIDGMLILIIGHQTDEQQRAEQQQAVRESRYERQQRERQKCLREEG